MCGPSIRPDKSEAAEAGLPPCRSQPDSIWISGYRIGEPAVKVVPDAAVFLPQYCVSRAAARVKTGQFPA
jgi:hypothetical protein